MHRTSRRKLPLSEKLDSRTKKSLRPIFRRKVNPPLGIPSLREKGKKGFPASEACEFFFDVPMPTIIKRMEKLASTWK